MKKSDNWNLITLSIAMVMLVVMSIVVGFAFGKEAVNKNVPVVCYDFKSLNETLSLVHENCDSNLMTWDYSGKWVVFVPEGDCDSTGRCKPHYNADISDCLSKKVSP